MQSGASESEYSDWRWQIEHSVSGETGLRSIIGHGADALVPVCRRYPFKVTPYYLSLCDMEDALDPIRIQCVPDVRELESSGILSDDPFGEAANMPVPGLVHRFADRALVVASSECAVNCRHCTRKNTLNGMHMSPSREFYQPMIDYIAGDGRIREVIVSGGEPLLIDTGLLDWLLWSMSAIEHVEVLRLGTRVPVVLPMRIDAALCDLLAAHRPLWINTHFNHPRELTRDAVAACRMLVDAGIPVSNQTVLLRGVNDNDQTMRELCVSLQRNMIRPYYVFQCDPVCGTEHLRTDDGRVGEMGVELRKSVGGLAVPRFVADIPGAASKKDL